jgi:hypothetical protein
MVLTLKKIEHRHASRIGVFFPYHRPTSDRLKALGATYSRTWRCWYFDYTRENYQLLKQHFPDLVVLTSNETKQTHAAAAGSESRDLPSIAPVNDAVKQREAGSKLPDRGHAPVKQEHKAAPVPLAQKLHVQGLFQCPTVREASKRKPENSKQTRMLHSIAIHSPPRLMNIKNKKKTTK